jgi:hypothetical protein
LNGRTPSSVTRDNEDEVRLDAYLVRQKKKMRVPRVKKSRKRRKPFTLKIGDKVRITHLKRTFQRDYDQTYTEEIFVVRDRFVSQGIPIYRLKDMMDDPIKGTFYTSELQKVSKGEDAIWRIEKIVRKRKVRGKEEVLVRWLGWPKKFDSWISKSDIKET